MKVFKSAQGTSRFNGRVSRRSRAIAPLAMALVLLTGTLASADNVVNDISSSSSGQTIAAGGSVTVGYRINATGGDGQNGCNAADTSPASLSFVLPAGVTATPVSFTTCGDYKNVTFSAAASAPASSTSVTASVTDSGPGTYVTSGATFILNVTAPTDTTAPTANPTYNANWSSSDVTVTWNWADNVGGSGLSASTSTNCPTTSTSSGEGTILLAATCRDNAGNTGNSSATVKVDRTAPVVTAAASPAPNAAGWNNTNVTVAYSASDTGSPITCDAATVLTTEGTGLSATGACTDAAGNTGSATASGIKIDKTAPVVTAAASPAANSNGWNKADVTVTYTAPIGGSAITCSPASTLTNEGIGQTATGSCTDEAGNTGTATKTISIDRIAPTATPAADPSSNGNGWNNTNVTITWNWADNTGGSGLDIATLTNCPESSTSSGEGEITLESTCTDRADNGASSSATVKVDKTAPTAAPAADPGPNGNGWNNTNVTITWNWADNGSGLTPTTLTNCPETSTSSGEGEITLESTCTDRAGNTGTATRTVKVDTIAPVVTAAASPAPNAAGWNNTNVTVTYTAPAGGSLIICDPASALSNEGIGLSATGNCTDQAGNTSSATANGIKIDKTAPTVSIQGPTHGGSYFYGSVPAATCSASDELSGLLGVCTVPTAGTTVDLHTLTASATDIAGNVGTASATYTVRSWTLSGFFRPVDMGNVVNTVKGGSTVPLKFRIFAGAELTNTSSIRSLAASPMLCGQSPSEAVEELSPAGSTTLRYDTDGNQFIYNWKTPKLPGKCYRVTLTTQDGSTIQADFKLT